MSDSINATPVFADPSESYRDPFFLLSTLREADRTDAAAYATLRKRVYAEIDELLLSESRVRFMRAFASVFQLADEDIPARLTQTIAAISAGGLTADCDRIEPEELDELLHHPDALQRAHLARVQQTPPVPDSDPWWVIFKKFKGLAVAAMVFFAVGTLTGAVTAKPQLAPAFIRGLLGIVIDRFQFDQAEALCAAKHKVWSSGRADGKWFRSIRLVIEPELPAEFQSKAKLTQTLGHNSSDDRAVPFHLHFEAPPDGLYRKVTIELVPHENVKAELEESLQEDDELLKALIEHKQTINVACLRIGATVTTTDEGPPTIVGEGIVEGSMATLTLQPQTGSGFVTLVIAEADGRYTYGTIKRVHRSPDGSVQPVDVSIGIGASQKRDVIPVAAPAVSSPEELKELLEQGQINGPKILPGMTKTIHVTPGFPVMLGRPSEDPAIALSVLQPEVEGHMTSVSYEFEPALLDEEDVWLGVIPATSPETIWIQGEMLESAKGNRDVNLGSENLETTGKYWVVLLSSPKGVIEASTAIPLVPARKAGLKALRVLSLHRSR